MLHVCSAPPVRVGAFTFPAAARRGETGRVRTLPTKPANGAVSNPGATR